MRDRRLLGLSGLLFSIVLASITPFSVSAATHTTFGAKLTHSTQPTGRESCDNSAHISSGATCTWVAVDAAHNGGHQQAPKTGTIHKVKLISCTAGSFRLQVARVKPGTRKAKVVVDGPTIHYVADNQSQCGGPDGTNYVIQSFTVNLSVTKGDYIAVRAKSLGFIYNSGGTGVLLFDPPLVAGNGYQTADTTSSADLLLQFQY